MVIEAKLPDLLLILLALLSSSGSVSGLSFSLVCHHHHHHHHHPIPRDLSIPIPILSTPLKQSEPSSLNKYHQSHPLSHSRLFLRGWFWLLENPKPKYEDATDQTSTASLPRKLLDRVQQPNSITKTSISPNTFMPVTTIPSLNPAVPLATPITTVPSTNQVPAFPYNAPPVMVPVQVPPPLALGQTWCVARPDVSETVLQDALDYACGFGGADCTKIQFMRSCYNPNTVRAHASYAFNSYYQRNPVPSSCDFSAAAMLINVDPSSSNCTYPSSSVSSYKPTERGGDPASGLPELNTDYSGSTSVLGSDNSATSCSKSSAISGTVVPLIIAFIVAHI